MDTFSASNGIKIVRNPGGSLGFITTGTDHYVAEYRIRPPFREALAEFFRAEEDERLGRWRWPEDPDYVVYPVASRNVRVFRESIGKALGYMNEGAWPASPGSYSAAARAYFDAHPEPTPWWKEAKTGEVWIAELPAGPVACVARMGEGLCDYEGNKLSFRDGDTGRRIWPEVD